MKKKQPPVTLETVFNLLVEFKESTENRFEKIDGRFKQIDQRFENIEGTLATLTRDVNKTAEALNTNINTTIALQKTVDKNHFTLIKIENTLDEINANLKDDLTPTQKTHTAQISKHERKITEHDYRIKTIETSKT